MEIEHLIQRLRYPLRKTEVVECARTFAQIPNGDELMFNLSVGDDEAVKLHTAWIFELLVLGNPDKQVKWFYPIIEAMPRVGNQSVRRFFAKQIKFVLKSKKLRNRICEAEHQQEFQQLAEVAFDWLLCPEAIVSVQSNCIEVLALLMDTNPWVRAELPTVVRNLASIGSPAIRCKVIIFDGL